MQIDNERVTAAVLATGVGPLALEEGSNLVDAWTKEWAGDAKDQILAVECGWSVRLDELTWAIGVMDMVARDEKGVFGSEWKSTKEPGRYWNEDKWLESIKTGPQVGVYALALRDGRFYTQTTRESGGLWTATEFNCGAPIRIRVRAAVKLAVPIFWPKNPDDGMLEFRERDLDAIAHSFRVKAAAIRASRKTGLVPWQFPGRQCWEFNRACEYLEECNERSYPKDQLFDDPFDNDDPAAKLALPFLPEEARSADAVVLSASAYQDYSKCMELGRRNALGGGKEENLAIQTGTVLHAGVAEFYRQLREQQQ